MSDEVANGFDPNTGLPEYTGLPELPADAGDASIEQELAEALGDLNLWEVADDTGEPDTELPPGVRRGRVLAIQKDDIFVDLGGKSQGILKATQFEDDPLPKVDEVIEVVVEGYDDRDGLLLLTRQGAVQAAAWDTLQQGQIIEGLVVAANKGGLELDLKGIRAFLPLSHIELHRVEDTRPYMNMKVRAEVIEVNRGDKKVVVSRRELLRAEEAVQKEKAFEQLEEGNTIEGVVKTIMPYGAFVDIGGVDGLLHVSDMSYSRVDDPKSVVQEGQTIEVKILKIDRENRKIALGLKQTLADPWHDVEAKWAIDSIVTGRVTKLMDFGAFVEIEEGVEGLVPISEMTYTRRINHPKEITATGETIKVRVLTVDPTRKRISLSIKQVQDDPWIGASVRWPADSVAEGRVSRIAEFGAFVELAEGVDGLVHISELSDQHVRDVTDVIDIGQTVQAKVLEVDENKRRISLSIKQLVEMPDYTGEPTDQPEQPVQKKPSKPRRGGLDF